MGLEITSDDEKLKEVVPTIRVRRADGDEIFAPCTSHEWSRDERVSVAYAGAMTRYCKKCPAEALSEMMRSGSLE